MDKRLEIILYQSKDKAKFKAERIRKNIKAALIENNVSFNSNLNARGSIVHLIAPFPFSVIKQAKENEKQIVLSVFYTKEEHNNKSYVSVEQFFKQDFSKIVIDAFGAADKVLVPLEEYKEALISKGIEKDKIEIVTSGINLQIYKFLPETDMGLAKRYFSIGPETKIILSFVDYEDNEALDRLNAVALARPDSIVITIGTGKYKKPLFKRFSKNYKKQASNLILSSFIDINIYRSLLKNARVVLFMNSYLVDEVQILESLAAETQIIAYDKAMPRKYLQPFILHTDDLNDLNKMLFNYLDYKISSTVSDAYFFVENCDVKQLGERLKEIYNTLE